jgi:hypothetical protein
MPIDGDIMLRGRSHLEWRVWCFSFIAFTAVNCHHIHPTPGPRLIVAVGASLEVEIRRHLSSTARGKNASDSRIPYIVEWVEVDDPTGRASFGAWPVPISPLHLWDAKKCTRWKVERADIVRAKVDCEAN